jgi:hypothetical protein
MTTPPSTAPLADHEPDRERVRHGAAAHAGHERRRIEGRGLAMAYKLLATAQERWRRLNGHHLVADVLDGVKFQDGIKVTDDDNNDNETTDEKVAA